MSLRPARLTRAGVRGLADALSRARWRACCASLLGLLTIGLVLLVGASPAVDDYGAIERLRFLALTFTRFLACESQPARRTPVSAVAGIPVTMLHELGHGIIALAGPATSLAGCCLT